MALFDAASSASFSPDDDPSSDERASMIESANMIERASMIDSANMVPKPLHRTLSSPPLANSSSRPSRSRVPTSKSSNLAMRESLLQARSLRSISSPSRMSFFSRRNNLKHPKGFGNYSGSIDLKFSRHKEPKLLQSQISLESTSQTDLILETPRTSNSAQALPQLCYNRVGRSVSSPENLLPNLNQRASFRLHTRSPRSPRPLQFVHALAGNSQTRAPIMANASFLQSPSISAADLQNISDMGTQSLCSPATTGVSSSLESGLYSSRISVGDGNDGNDSYNYFEMNSTSPQNRYLYFNSNHGSHLWLDEAPQGIRLSSETLPQNGPPRISQLTLAHLASRDLNAIHYPSPPPSYEKLCNPEALPSYQEALDDTTIGSRRVRDSRLIFTLPSGSDFRSSYRNPLLQEAERTLNGGILSSFTDGDLSDSDGGYTTILDAIPIHPARDSCPSVPIQFIAQLSPSHLRFSGLGSLCVNSMCNKSLVMKEINRRWPFILNVVEDEWCPGLLLVECTSNLSMAQLPEIPRSADCLQSRSFFSTFRESSTTSDRLPPDVPNSEPNAASTATTTEGRSAVDGLSTNIEELETLNSHLVFYLCGKCVMYDSFDAESVRTHIEYDCTGPLNKWANISELYLVLRACCVALVVVLILVWLSEQGKWQ